MGARAHEVGSIEGRQRMKPRITLITLDAVMAQAAEAGAGIVKSARDTFWGGYAGYFQDPDGHLWEVAWNPQWGVPE